MSATLVIVLLLLVVGERAGDTLERRQHEVVLGKLPLREAHAHYERLRRRSRKRALPELRLGRVVRLLKCALRLSGAGRGADDQHRGERQASHGK